MKQDDQRRVEVMGQQLNETYEAGYKVGYQAGVEMGREWLPRSIDLFVHECAVALGNCSNTVPGDDDEPRPWPSPEDLLKTLRQPAPWPLAAVIAELCRGVFVDPPELVVEALKGCDESPFGDSKPTPSD
ncbi:MAG: hypothetical protein WBW04_12230 [Nitrolancea sp.]